MEQEWRRLVYPQVLRKALENFDQQKPFNCPRPLTTIQHSPLDPSHPTSPEAENTPPSPRPSTSQETGVRPPERCPYDPNPHREVDPNFRDPPRPIPKYIKPKKGDKIYYFDPTSDTWEGVTILSKIRGYGGDWYNIQENNGNKCSKELADNTL